MKSGHHEGPQASLNTASEANVSRLLRELHEKKRWLDMLIEGLEAAAGSPHHQLIERAARMFENGQRHRPKVDLHPQQQRILAELASQVGRRRGRVRRVETAQAA